jgi:cobalt-zinc-cadmium efflux system outer membrane protein
MVRILICICLALCAGPARAQEAAGESLHLQDAIRLTLERSPRLQGHRFTLNAAAARRDAANLRPPLEVSLDVENILGTGPLSAFDDTEATLRLGTVLELGGKRAGRIGVAESERDLIANTQDTERLDMLAEVTRRFIDALRAQEEIKLAERTSALAARTADLVKARITAGRAPSTERSSADLAVLRAASAGEQAAADAREAWAKLSAAWGETPERGGTALGSLFALPAVGDFATVATLLERNPALARFAKERRLQEANLRLADASRSPDVTVSGGIRRLQALRAQAAVLSVSVPLGSAARSGPRAAEARNALSAVDYAEAAQRNELRATLFGLHQQLAVKRKQFEVIRAEALPLAERAVKDTEDGFRAGRFSFVELTTAQRQALDLHQDAIAAAAAFHLLFLELERLTGQSAPDAVNLETQP